MEEPTNLNETTDNNSDVLQQSNEENDSSTTIPQEPVVAVENAQDDAPSTTPEVEAETESPDTVDEQQGIEPDFSPKESTDETLSEEIISDNTEGLRQRKKSE